MNAPVRNTKKLHVIDQFSLDPAKWLSPAVTLPEDPVYLKGTYTGSYMVFPRRRAFRSLQVRGVNVIDYSKQQKQ